MDPAPELDGDPAYPEEVDGVRVREHLRTRREERGALVSLTDGRYALTGSTLARSDSLWEIAEPSPPVLEAHTYHWQFADLTVRTLAASGSMATGRIPGAPSN